MSVEDTKIVKFVVRALLCMKVYNDIQPISTHVDLITINRLDFIPSTFVNFTSQRGLIIVNV